MKKNFLFLLVVFTVFFVACGGDNNSDTVDNQEETGIFGVWKIKDVEVLNFEVVTAHKLLEGVDVEAYERQSIKMIEMLYKNQTVKFTKDNFFEFEKAGLRDMHGTWEFKEENFIEAKKDNIHCIDFVIDKLEKDKLDLTMIYNNEGLKMLDIKMEKDTTDESLKIALSLVRK